MPTKITGTKTGTPVIRQAASFVPAIKYGFDPGVLVLIIVVVAKVSGISLARVSGIKVVRVSGIKVAGASVTVVVRALATEVEAGADVDALRFIK
jgi:hypothetical protein